LVDDERFKIAGGEHLARLAFGDANLHIGQRAGSDDQAQLFDRNLEPVRGFTRA